MKSSPALLAVLLGSLALTGCVDSVREPAEPGDGYNTEVGASGTMNAVPVQAPACATPQVASWVGVAGRASEPYPDDVAATVRWELVGSVGCVDRYAPAGDAIYRFAIPGAQCSQTISPSENAVGATAGLLTIDRSTVPATYTGAGSTTWAVTWTCTYEDGNRETMTFDAGGMWFEGSGTTNGTAIDGTKVEEDGLRCGTGQSSLPCTYTWSFAAAE